MGNLAPLGALSGAAGGMADAVAGIIEQRLRQAQVANQVQDTQARLAETQRAHQADEAYRTAQLAQTTAWQTAQADESKRYHDQLDKDRMFNEGKALNESMPPGTDFSPSNPMARYLSSVDKPSYAEAPPASIAADPTQQGPVSLPGTIANAPSPVAGRLLTKTPTFHQIDTMTDNARQAATAAAAANKPKTLSAMEADKISEFDKGIAVIQGLRSSLAGADTGGMAQAKANLVPNALAGLIPGAPEAKATQADIVRAQQVVGRIIHGGVLRANDQVQAQRYMPQLGDAPSVITSKLDAVEKLAQESRTSHVGNLGKAGYDVSNFAAADTAPPGKDATAATTPAAAPAAPGAAATGKRKVYDQRGNLLNPSEGSSDVSSPASAVPTTPTTSSPAGVLRTAPTTETHQLSPEGLQTLQEREGGFYDTPYSDSGTGLAIGYGMHTFNGQPVKPDLRITKEQADQEMTKQIQQTYAPIVDRALKVPVTQAQYDALISMAWNSPASTLAVIQKLNTGTALSPADFQRSATVKGQPNAGLSQRRSREAAPFLNP